MAQVKHQVIEIRGATVCLNHMLGFNREPRIRSEEQPAEGRKRWVFTLDECVVPVEFEASQLDLSLDEFTDRLLRPVASIMRTHRRLGQ